MRVEGPPLIYPSSGWTCAKPSFSSILVTISANSDHSEILWGFGAGLDAEKGLSRGPSAPNPKPWTPHRARVHVEGHRELCSHLLSYFEHNRKKKKGSRKSSI